MLKEKYEQIVLHPQYITATVANGSEHVDLDAVNEKDTIVNHTMGDDDMVEVLLVSDEYAIKIDGENEAYGEECTEEYEILEVEQSEENGTFEPNHSETKNIQLIEEADESDMVDVEPEVVKVKREKSSVIGVRRSLRGNAQQKLKYDEQSKNENVRQPRKSSMRLQKHKNDASNEKKRIPANIQRSDLHEVEHYADEADEGESDDEFPARDSDNDDWPAHQTISEFPKKILRDGLLQIKGKQLMSMICK